MDAEAAKAELEMQKRLYDPLKFETTPELVERILKDPKLVTDFGLAGMDAEAAKAELEMLKRLYRPLHFETTPDLVELILKRPKLVTDFGLESMDAEAAKAELEMQKRLRRPLQFTLSLELAHRIIKLPKLVKVHGLEKMNAVSALAQMKKLQREHGGWSPPPEPTDGDFKAFETRIGAEWREWSSQNTAEDVAAAWHSRRGKGNFVACERYFHFNLDISPNSFRCIALSQAYRDSEVCQEFEGGSLDLFNCALDKYVRLVEASGGHVCIFVAAKCLTLVGVGDSCTIGDRSRAFRVGHPSYHHGCQSYNDMLLEKVCAAGDLANADIAFFGLAQTKSLDGYKVSPLAPA
jgi:hypothetical protein